MKFLRSIIFSALATVAFSQSVEIGYPPAGKKIHPGQNLTVQIVQPNSIQGSFTLGIAIGIESCSSSPCQPPSAIMGNVLYNGPFTPKRPSVPPFQSYQNFTVQIPNLPKGPAQLNVAYAALWGAGSSPAFDTLNETLIVTGT